jgi:uncharacterized protein DUF4397
MTPLRCMAICAAAVAVLGCKKDATFVEPLPDYAAIHWLNAVPDTGQQDIRVIDIVSNAGLFDANFRGSNMFYYPIESGARTVRIFNSSADITIASQVLSTTTVTTTVGQGYTFIHAGFARTGQTPARTVLVIPDNPTAPAAGEVGVRFIHAAAGLGNLDFNVVRHASDTLTLPATPLRGNVAFGTATTYSGVKADSMRVFHPRALVDSIVFYDTLRVVATAAGTTTPILFSTVLPFGSPNTINQVVQPIAGAALAGSVITTVAVPRSVAGSKAEPPVLATPAGIVFVDRRPATLNPAP